MSAFNWSAVAFILAAIGLVVFMLVVPRLLGGRSQGLQKEEIFEAGVVGSGNARIRLSAKFYLVAIFFVIFDLEALYLYAYSVSVREAGWLGFAAAAQQDSGAQRSQLLFELRHFFSGIGFFYQRQAGCVVITRQRLDGCFALRFFW